MKICMICHRECENVFRGEDEPCCSKDCARVAYEEEGAYAPNEKEQENRDARLALLPTGIILFCVVCGSAFNRTPFRDEYDPCDSPECAQTVYHADGVSKHNKETPKPAWQAWVPEDAPRVRELRAKIDKPGRKVAAKPAEEGKSPTEAARQDNQAKARVAAEASGEAPKK